MEDRKPAPKPSRAEQITRLVRSFIGPRWESHYAKAWRKLGTENGVNLGVSWNWAAALLTVPWLAYRRQWELALGLIGVWALAHFFGPELWPPLTRYYAGSAAAWLVIAIVAGCFGDVVILQAAYAAAAEAHNDAGASMAVASTVMKKGGVRARNVVFALGTPAVLIAAVYWGFVVPKLERGRRMAEDSVRVYLDEVSTMEEQFHVDSGRYIADPRAFAPLADSLRYQPPVIIATDSSYQATVSDARSSTDEPRIRCAIAVGAANPLSGETTNGPVCRRYFDR